MSVVVAMDGPHLLKHLVVGLGPDIQLETERRIVVEILKHDDSFYCRNPTLRLRRLPLTPDLAVIRVDVLVEASDDGAVDEQTPHHQDGL